VFTYREQLELLEGVKLKEGQTRRLDCPFCGGGKTLGISCKDGAQVWHCFKASCGVRGSKNVGRTLEGLRNKIHSTIDSSTSYTNPLPPSLSPARNHPEAMAYLSKVNSLEAYENGLVDVRYSPALRRVIFMKPDNEGGVGRSLRNEKPKWKNFGDTSGLLTVGTGSVAVIVEDAASAASVSRFALCSGCALLGTNITSLQRHQLLPYKRVIVALDKDASRKAIKLKSKLEGRLRTSVLLLEDDLKYVPYATMERMLL
jgi:hypothetical protein